MHITTFQRLSTSLAMVGLLLALTVLSGCGSGAQNSNFSGTSTQTASSSTTTTTTPAPAATPLPASVNIQPQVPAGTPGAASLAPHGIMASVMGWFITPVYAADPRANILTLPGATVNAINGQGSVVATATTNSSGIATFNNLPPGTYTFTVSKNIPGGGVVQLSLVTDITPNSTQTLPVTTATTAIAEMILAAGNGQTAGVDLGAFNGLSNSGNAQFQTLQNEINNAVASGTPIFDPGSGVPTNSQISQSSTAAANQIFTVVFRYPAPNQTGVHRLGPIAVCFNKAVNQAGIPPTYQNWQVTHTTVSTGVSLTITPSNFTQFGNWNYSDTQVTVNGVTLPAHCLYFTLSSTMSAFAQEVYIWQFAQTPTATDGSTLTLTGADQPGQLNNLTFFTGSDN